MKNRVVSIMPCFANHEKTIDCTTFSRIRLNSCAQKGLGIFSIRIYIGLMPNIPTIKMPKNAGSIYVKNATLHAVS